MTSRKVTATTASVTTHTKQAIKFSEGDDSFPYRLVGTYEYGKALDFLGRLVDASTPEQIKVYDKLIAMNPEYSFYSGVASNLGLRPNLEAMSSEQRSELNKKFRRSSLAWMMALARVELGATVSMYGEKDDPFGVPVAIGGSQFGAQEYLQILVDDLAAHLKAAGGDENYQKALNPKLKVDDNSLAFLRRTQLIDDMLTKVVSSGNSEIVSQAEPYAKEADKYVNTMVGKIEYATTSYSQAIVGDPVAKTYVQDSGPLAARFVNRGRLLNCQRNLERRLPAPKPIPSPLGQ